MRIPRVVQLRMVINAAIDLLIGIVPVVGDLFDFGWKANVMNLGLLERYAQPGSKASRGDWILVAVVIGTLFALAVLLRRCRMAALALPAVVKCYSPSNSPIGRRSST